jgi:hypothetical protein
MKHPYLAHGLDMQGRHPEAAHAATDLGANDPDFGNGARGIVFGLMLALFGWFIVALAALAIWWPA